jgi:HPt (histidine-containing phosphotransfer) domain-containing protein
MFVTMDRYYELEDQRRSLVMLPPGSPSGLSREDAVNLIRELQDSLRIVAALRAARAP